MKPVNMRRPRQVAVALASVAAMAWLAPQHASAEIANPAVVPSNSAYIVSIPDGRAFWSAWEANGLYEAYKKVVAMPEVEEKLSNFRKEMSIVEGSLGFKIDGKTLSSVLGSMDVYMVPPAAGSEEPAMIALFKVTDQDKLSKLIDLAEKAAAQSVEGGTTETESADKAATSPITESDYQGVKIKTFTSPAGEDEEGKPGKEGKLVYARMDDRLLVGNTEANVHKVIDGLKTAPASGTVATSEEYKKIDTALAAEKGEVYIYGNQKLAMELEQNADDANSREMLAAIKKAVESFTPVSYYGASVKFAPKEISSYSYGLLDAPTSDSVLAKYPGTTPLKVASYIPEGTLLSAATSLMDAPTIYNVITSVGDAGLKKAEKKEEATSDENMEEKLKKAEGQLGFSIKDDLVPALGNEIAFGINEVKMGGFIPQVDATLVISVKDKAKMTKVTDNLERLAVKAMASKSEDSNTSAPTFESETVNGQTVKTIEVNALAGLNPGYVLTDQYLIIGSTKSALKATLDASAGKNLLTSDAFKSLGHNISENANVLQFVNLGKALDVAGQVAKNFPAAKDFVKYLEALQVLDVSASANRVENGATVSNAVLKLK